MGGTSNTYRYRVSPNLFLTDHIFSFFGRSEVPAAGFIQDTLTIGFLA